MHLNEIDIAHRVSERGKDSGKSRVFVGNHKFDDFRVNELADNGPIRAEYVGVAQSHVDHS